MDTQPPRDWLHTISPCVIAAALALFVMIYGLADLRASGGWSYLVTFIASIFLFAVVVIAVIARLVARKRAGLLWLIEIAALVITVVLFRNTFM